VIVVTSRFRVVNGMEQDVADAFRRRPRRVEQAAGFLGLEVFTEADEPGVFHLVTRWTDRASYEAWHGGAEHKASHALIPKELELDPGATRVTVLELVPDVDPDQARVRDHVLLLTSFLAQSQAVQVAIADRSGRLEWVSPGFAALVGRPGAELADASLWDLLLPDDAARLEARVASGSRARDRFRLNFRDDAGQHASESRSAWIDLAPERFTLLVEGAGAGSERVQQELFELSDALAADLREQARRGRELARARDELDAAHWHLRKLQEVLPICMECSRVRREPDVWQSLASFIMEQSSTPFLSHSYCPTCYVQVRDRMRGTS